MHRSKALLRIPALLLAAMAAAPAAGQQLATFEFSFSNPGARSLGFGGAFVALADDATAAFANPAGLVQLLEPEVSIEGRAWSYSTPYFAGGRFEGQATGFGIDTVSGLSSRRSEADLTELSFLSLVYPRKRWSLAFYRHQLASYEFASELQGYFGGSIPATIERRAISRGAIDLELVTHSIAAAFRVSENLSLGLGLCYFDGNQLIEQEIYRWDEDSFEGFFAESSFLPRRLVFTSTRRIDDQDWGLAAGLLWRMAGGFRLGASFRQGPELEDRAVIRGGPLSQRLFPQSPPGTVIEFSVPLAFPDVYALGAAFRSRGGRLTVSSEWDRVEYSALLENAPESDNFIEDADEFHLGVELAFPESTPLLAVRLGSWLETPHRLRSRSNDALSLALFPPGDDEIHLAVGIGAVFGHFQIDLGADFSDLRDTVSLSAIAGF